MQELLSKRKHLFFLHFFTNYCESQRTHMIIFCGSQAQILAKKRNSLRKFHRTYGLPLENYLSNRANHYRKCPTVRRPLGNTERGHWQFHHHHPGEGLKSRLECRKPCVKSVQPNKRVVCAGLKLFTCMSSSSGMI